MADSFHEEDIEDAPPNTAADVEMAEGAGDDQTPAATNGAEPSFTEADAPVEPRIGFLQYLASPIVTLLVGSGDSEHILTAHQGLLTQSTFFADQYAEFTDDGSVCRRMTLFLQSPEAN